MLERRLSLASELPGLRLRSTLAAGTTHGGTVLAVDGRQRSVTGFITVDNSLSAASGRNVFGLGPDANPVFGRGATIHPRVAGLHDTGRRASLLDPTPRNRTPSASVILPTAATLEQRHRPTGWDMPDRPMPSATRCSRRRSPAARSSTDSRVPVAACNDDRPELQ